MPRKPRLEYAGAVYHVTARGARQAAIFIDDDDRVALLKILACALRELDGQVFAFCLMGNHYHFVLQTREANLSTLMRRVNSLYGMRFNQRHARFGHVFDGRFNAVHVDRDAYLLEACRYVDLNPVRAALVERPEQWRWTSYRAHVGSIRSPGWLATTEVHGVLTGRTPKDPAQIAQAQHLYAKWVASGREVRLWEESLRQRIYLGDEAFIERVKRLSG